ncbi:hypothetical protein MKX03_030967 [Papaver bracteatum]|nr:hypothetical protein MKX03_030967 [Papaver bracteatum]
MIHSLLNKLKIPKKRNLLKIPAAATNRTIPIKDHASVQLNIGHIDKGGIYTGQFSTFSLSNFVCAQGKSCRNLWAMKKKKKYDVDI